MRRLVVIALCAALVLSVATRAVAAPAPLTPAEAVALALESDGAPATVHGEALGEALAAPGGKRWVNIGREGTAIGVVMTAEQAAEVPRFGLYRQRGATLEVSGVLNSACDEHGGDLDLHADTVSVLDEGGAIVDPLHPGKLWLAGASATIALALWARYRQLRRRRHLA